MVVFKSFSALVILVERMIQQAALEIKDRNYGRNFSLMMKDSWLWGRSRVVQPFSVTGNFYEKFSFFSKIFWFFIETRNGIFLIHFPFFSTPFNSIRMNGAQGASGFPPTPPLLHFPVFSPTATLQLLKASTF